MKRNENSTLRISDHFLVSVVVGLSFFMMVIEESSLYTILPKYLSNEQPRSVINKSLLTTTNVTTNQRLNQTPQYIAISMIFLSKNLAMIAINPMIGFISDRVNNYFILILSHILGIAVLVTYAFNNTLWMFIIGRIVDAVVTCIIFVAVYFIISKLFRKTVTRGRYYGYVNTVFSVSHSIGPVYGAVVDDNYGKEVVFIVLIPFWLTCAILTYVLYWRVRKIKTEKKSPLKTIHLESFGRISLLETNLSSGNLNIESQPQVIVRCSQEMNTRSNPSIILNKKNKRFFVISVLRDKFVMSCMFQIFIVNLSMFSLPATLPSWMGFKLHSTEVQQGMVWSFGFTGYMFGVVCVTLIDSYCPLLRNFAPICAQVFMGILLIALPFSHDWRLLFLPIIGMYISVGIVEQVLLPLTTYLADLKFNSNYGTMASLTSQSLNISSVFSTLCSGYLAENLGFHWLVITLGILNLLFSPISVIHRKINPV